MKYKLFAISLFGIISSNISLLWKLTSMDILEVVFGGLIIATVEAYALYFTGYLAILFVEWQIAEKNRIRQAEAKRRRRKNFKDIKLRRPETDVWIEVEEAI